MKVTFLGLGIMGSRMAANLLSNNVDLTVYNRSQEPVNELKSNGAKTAERFSDAVNEADIVFTMLSTPEVVSKVMFGDEGCLQSMKENALWVDCTTVNPAFSKQSEKEAHDRKVRFMDAPVAGSKPQAESASLTILAGGSKNDFKEAETFLNYMGEKVLHVGEVSKGTSLKMLINAMLGESMLIFSETLSMGEKIGFSKDFLLDTLPNLPVIAPFTKAKAELIREENFDPQFPLEWMLKDFNLALKTAGENGVKPQLASLARDIFNEANEKGYSRKDFSAIYQHLAGK